MDYDPRETLSIWGFDISKMSDADVLKLWQEECERRMRELALTARDAQHSLYRLAEAASIGNVDYGI